MAVAVAVEVVEVPERVASDHASAMLQAAFAQ